MMRRFHLKGDVLCTVILLLLCLVLYSWYGFQNVRNPWPLTERLTSPPAALTATHERRTLVRGPNRLTDRATCQTQSRAPASVQPRVSPRKEEPPTGLPAATHPPFDFQQYLRNKDCRHFRLLIDQPGKCSGGPGEAPFLLIAVKSVAADFDKRQVVRHTWGQERAFPGGLQVRTVFLLGVPQNQTQLPMWDRLLAYESQSFGDILLWDFEDTFFNLTLKETHFLQWVDRRCPGVRFIFKGDADVYVNVENILEMLQGQESSKDLFIGDIIVHARPIRRKASKYFIPELMYGLGIYPSYAGGGGFVMSGFTARRLHLACQQVELFPIDDVFLGMCLRRLGLRPVRHDGFRTFGIMRPSAAPHLQIFDPCFYRELMVVHSLTVPQIWLMWRLLHDPRLLCHTRPSQPARPFRWRGGPQAMGTPSDQDYSSQAFVRH
ncbi:UDP-GlcNAc:betaGal beta-1,3-N-acetylglucosaminyltransferase 9 [Paramormyrops kingsleyae]|uniref:UDP-GlcNAc:betaGal beta-1,3-N-acetylglucosaminyltransferase 9 n=1 Tax=Paramormyrops kingsleyae TaxID=1676925 RepID=UPI003B977C36